MSGLPLSRPDPPKCKETSNLMWLSLIWFILVLFVCWNLFCTIANLRIKCVTEIKNVSVLFHKNLKSSFSTWLTHTHLPLRFLYILGSSGPWCVVAICLLSLKKNASSKIIFPKSDSLYSPPRDPSGNLPANGESSFSSIYKLLSVAHQVALLVDSETI